MITPNAVREIIDDNLSGSVTLLKRLMVVLENELINPEYDPATFIALISHIREKMEMFTVIRHFCDELILSHNVSIKQFPINYLDFINNYKEFWEQAPAKLLNNLQKTIDLRMRTIMLHSNSGTIREVFRLLSKSDTSVHIYQTISSPAEEGRIQAHDLASMGFKVTLISDALAAEKLKKSHYLILSADQIRKNTIVNKIGSLQMVLAAQEFNVPAYILTESRKRMVDNETEFEDRQRDKSEILKDIRHPNIGAVNIYFEEVPKYLFTGIITEKYMPGKND